MTRFWKAAAVLFVFGSACSFGVNPDAGRFSCDTVRDCGKGYECIDQVGSDRGLCFPVGACEADERACDGKDEDCNGAVDDVSWAGVACVTDRPGVCGPGKRQCVDAVSVCVSDVEPSAEVCDGADNDCDGALDEDFDLDSDQANCGACGLACPSGTTCRFTLCEESDCANGLDDDGDLAADCNDVNCLGLDCEAGTHERACGLVAPEALDAGADAGFGDDAGVELDAGAPDAGSAPAPACVPRETACGDRVDQDGDELVDCADPDCEGLACKDAGTCAQGSCR